MHFILKRAGHKISINWSNRRFEEIFEYTENNGMQSGKRIKISRIECQEIRSTEILSLDYVICTWHLIGFHVCITKYYYIFVHFVSHLTFKVFFLSLPPWPSPPPFSLSLCFFYSAVECWPIQNTLNIVYITRNFVSATWIMVVMAFFYSFRFPNVI